MLLFDLWRNTVKFENAKNKDLSSETPLKADQQNLLYFLTVLGHLKCSELFLAVAFHKMTPNVIV